MTQREAAARAVLAWLHAVRAPAYVVEAFRHAMSDPLGMEQWADGYRAAKQEQDMDADVGADADTDDQTRTQQEETPEWT